MIPAVCRVLICKREYTFVLLRTTVTATSGTCVFYKENLTTREYMGLVHAIDTDFKTTTCTIVENKLTISTYDGQVCMEVSTPPPAVSTQSPAVSTPQASSAQPPASSDEPSDHEIRLSVENYLLKSLTENLGEPIGTPANRKIIESIKSMEMVAGDSNIAAPMKSPNIATLEMPRFPYTDPIEETDVTDQETITEFIIDSLVEPGQEEAYHGSFIDRLRSSALACKEEPVEEPKEEPVETYISTFVGRYDGDGVREVRKDHDQIFTEFITESLLEPGDNPTEAEREVELAKRFSFLSSTLPKNVRDETNAETKADTKSETKISTIGYDGDGVNDVRRDDAQTVTNYIIKSLSDSPEIPAQRRPNIAHLIQSIPVPT